MNKLALMLSFAFAGVTLTGIAANAGVPRVIGYPQATAKYLVMPPNGVDFVHLMKKSREKKTLPLWSSSVTVYGSKNYNYTMVGTDPTAGGSVTVPIRFQLFKFIFADGTVFDPTAPACGDKVPVINRVLRSPLFSGTDIVSNGVDVGKTQYEDAMQRAEFWTILGGSDYHVLLRNMTSVFEVYTIKVPRTEGETYTAAKACSGKFGVININWFARAVLTPLSRAWHPWMFPMAYMYNVFQSGDGKIDQCCILGYHGAYGKQFQTYGTAAYNDAGIFSVPIEDIHALSHEVGEWINDPSGGNPTPPWGNVGQVTGCQNNLEVGDPLTGTVFGPIKVNGFTYHPQELAFFSWFFRQVPTIGTGYSLGGTFTAPQGPCT